jgi:predicted DNA-binding transcriptional regulator AlpA
MDRLLTIKEACARMGISAASFYRYRMLAAEPNNRKFIKIIKLRPNGLGGPSRVFESEVEEYIAACKSR